MGQHLLGAAARERLGHGARAAQLVLGGLPLELAHVVDADEHVDVDGEVGRVVEALGERDGHRGEAARDGGACEHREREAAGGVRARELRVDEGPLLLRAAHREARERRGAAEHGGGRRAPPQQHREVGAAQHRKVVELALVEQVRGAPEVLVEAHHHHLDVDRAAARRARVERARALDDDRPREPRDLVADALGDELARGQRDLLVEELQGGVDAVARGLDAAVGE
eukprot:3385833-Prymnesium_polylepis.1